MVAKRPRRPPGATKGRVPGRKRAQGVRKAARPARPAARQAARPAQPRSPKSTLARQANSGPATPIGPKKPARANSYVANVADLFAKRTAANVAAHGAMLANKYKDAPPAMRAQLRARIDRAQELRASGKPVATKQIHKAFRRTAGLKAPHKNAFDKATADTSVKMPPMLCDGAPFNLAAPPQCAVDGLKRLVDPMFAERKALAASGGTVCGHPKLGPHQAAVFEVVRVMLKNGMDANKGQRGLVCWHSVGSGKTVLALCILIAAITSGTKYKVTVVTTPTNKTNNDHSVYADNLRTYFPQYLGLFGLSFDPKRDTDTRAWAKAAGAQQSFTKHLHLDSYTAETWWRTIPENSVLIMDECQNLIVQKGSASSAPLREKAAKLLAHLSSPAVMKKVYMFPLSATPSAGSVENFAKIANLARPLGRPAFTPNDPPEAYRGLVSYVELREDRSMFGELQGTGSFHQRVQNRFFEMGPKYFAAFLKQVQKEANLEYDKEKPEDFMKMLVQKGTILAASDVTGIMDIEEAKKARRVVRIGFGEGRGSDVILSSKIAEVLKNITSMPGKQYVFAANVNIAKALEAGLQQLYGYQRVGLKDIPKEPRRGAGGVKTVIPLFAKPPAKRYVFYGTGQRGDGSKGNPREKFETKHVWGSKTIMKSDQNLDGSYCRVMIASGQNFEGLDVNAWRGVHIVQPLSSKDDDEQAIGRALRACGHSKLPPKDRNAVVIRYFSVMPSKFNASQVQIKGDTSFIDEALETLREVGLKKGRTSPNTIVFEDAILRQRKLTHFESCLKQQAVDCTLFKAGLSYDHQCGGTCPPMPPDAVGVRIPGGPGSVKAKVKSKKGQRPSDPRQPQRPSDPRQPQRSSDPRLPQRQRPSDPRLPQRSGARPPPPPKYLKYAYAKYAAQYGPDAPRVGPRVVARPRGSQAVQSRPRPRSQPQPAYRPRPQMQQRPSWFTRLFGGERS